MSFLTSQLKTYRQTRQLTQKDLAAQLHVTDKAISKWETGRGYPELELLPTIADLLDMTVDDLLKENSPTRYFEYQSQQEFHQRPLLHIVIPNLFQRNPLHRLSKQNLLLDPAIPTASGIVAIGFKAKGILSFGVLAQGVIAVGVLPIGVIAIGLAGLGLLFIGQAGAGLMVLGNLVAGIFSIGNLALGIFTAGNLVLGITAIGNLATGPLSFSLGDNYTAAQFHEAVLKLPVTNPVIASFYQMIEFFSQHPLLVVSLVVVLILLILFPFAALVRYRRELFADI